MDISEEKTEKVEDLPAVVQTPEVETVVEVTEAEVKDDRPQKSPDVSYRVCVRLSEVSNCQHESNFLKHFLRP